MLCSHGKEKGESNEKKNKKKKNNLRLTGSPDEFQKICEPIQKEDKEDKEDKEASAQRLRLRRDCESIRNEPTPPSIKYDKFPLLTDYVQHALQSVYDGKIRRSFAEKIAARLLDRYTLTLSGAAPRGNDKKRLSLRQ